MDSPKRRKKPCSICRRWFLPDPRHGRRQKTCDAEACRKQWYRRRQQRWRRKNPDYFPHRRLTRRLKEAEARGDCRPVRRPPAFMAAIPWGLVQTASGLEMAVTTAFLLRILARAGQTSSVAKTRPESRFPRRIMAQSDQTSRDVSGLGADNSS
jgi:hypothetical protein